MAKGGFTEYSGVAPFGLRVGFFDILPSDPLNTHDDHIHNECEIYINLSGDVSFMVENRIYPIRRGSVVITRPCEYHHCIYHSNESHKHIWILFSSVGNERLLPIFFDRGAGEKNLVQLSEKQIERVCELCTSLTEENTETELRTLSDFLSVLSLLESCRACKEESQGIVPEDISRAIEFIGNNLGGSLTVSAVARASHISVNTLERRFEEVLRTTPSAYIKSRRLARAAELLPSCVSVGEVCERCGFQDYSNFISVFKKQFGVTPLKFKKIHQKRASELWEGIK